MWQEMRLSFRLYNNKLLSFKRFLLCCDPDCGSMTLTYESDSTVLTEDVPTTCTPKMSFAGNALKVIYHIQTLQ